MTDAHLQSPRPHAAGRAITVLAVITWVVMASALFVDLSGSDVPGYIRLAGLITVFGCWIAAKVVSGNLAERSAQDVDEYEGDLRARARNIGYVVLFAGAWISIVILAVAARVFDAGAEHLLDLAPEIVALATLPGMAAPTFWLAWNSRVDPEDDA